MSRRRSQLTQLLRRLGPVSGLLLCGLLVAAYVLGGPMPPAGTSPPQLEVFLASHSRALQWSWFLASGPALLFGSWFAGAMTAHLWDADPGARQLTAAGFAAALLTGGLLAAAGVTWGLFVYLGGQLTDASLVMLLAESRHFAEGAAGFPAAGALVAYSLAARRRLPGWRAVVAVGVVATLLQLADGVDDFVMGGVTGILGPVAFVALLAWVATVSLAWLAEIRGASSPSP